MYVMLAASFMGCSTLHIRTGFRIKSWGSLHIDLAINAALELMDSGSEWQLGGAVKC